MAARSARRDGVCPQLEEGVRRTRERRTPKRRFENGGEGVSNAFGLGHYPTISRFTGIGLCRPSPPSRLAVKSLRYVYLAVPKAPGTRRCASRDQQHWR